MSRAGALGLQAMCPPHFLSLRGKKLVWGPGQYCCRLSVLSMPAVPAFFSWGLVLGCQRCDSGDGNLAIDALRSESGAAPLTRSRETFTLTLETGDEPLEMDINDLEIGDEIPETCSVTQDIGAVSPDNDADTRDQCPLGTDYAPRWVYARQPAINGIPESNA
ncbi:unnamed protein product [Caretta caretta]